MNGQNSNFNDMNNMNGVPDNSNNFNNQNGLMSNKVYSPPSSSEMANNGMNPSMNMGMNSNMGMQQSMNQGMSPNMQPQNNGMNPNMNMGMSPNMGMQQPMDQGMNSNNQMSQNSSNLPFFQMPEQEAMPPKEKSKFGALMDKMKDKATKKAPDNDANINNNFNNNVLGSPQPMNQGMDQQPEEYVSGNVSFNPQMVNGQSSQFFNASPNQNTAQPVAPKRKFSVFGRKKKDKEIPSSWMNEQPLSMGALGASVLPDENEVDELENSMFFNPSAYEGNPGIVDRSMKVKTTRKKEKKYLENGSLLYNYLGDDYNTIAMVPFTMKGMLFGGLYLITHKVYLLGLALYAFQLYMLLYMSTKAGLIALGIFSLVMAFACNEIILIVAKMKVAIIRKLNSKKHEVQIVEIANKRGGTNFGLALILFILGVGLCGYTVFYKNNDKGMIGSGISFVKLKVDEFLHPFLISFDSGIKVDEVFNITLPESWQPTSQTIYAYSYTEKYMKIDLCSLEFGQLRGYSDIDKFSESLKKEYKIDKIDEEKVNKLVWKVASVTDKDGNKTDYRYTTVDTKIYLMKTYTNQNDTTNVCKNYFDGINKSISKK